MPSLKKRVEAREKGATPASKKRDLDVAKCSLVKLWLIDTGCGYDLVSQRAVALMQRFINNAKRTITFLYSNGPTVTEYVANIHVKELDEGITPCILKSTPPVLTVGYGCMEMGYTLIWPSGQSPFFIRPDGMIIHLVVEHYIPYLVPGEKRCKPQRPTGSMTFCSATPAPSSDHQPDVSGEAALSTPPTTKEN